MAFGQMMVHMLKLMIVAFVEVQESQKALVIVLDTLKIVKAYVEVLLVKIVLVYAVVTL